MLKCTWQGTYNMFSASPPKLLKSNLLVDYESLFHWWKTPLKLLNPFQLQDVFGIEGESQRRLPQRRRIDFLTWLCFLVALRRASSSGGMVSPKNSESTAPFQEIRGSVSPEYPDRYIYIYPLKDRIDPHWSGPNRSWRGTGRVIATTHAAWFIQILNHQQLRHRQEFVSLNPSIIDYGWTTRRSDCRGLG